MIKKEHERDNQNSDLKMEYDPEYSASGSDYGADDDSDHKGSRYSRSKAQQNLNKPKTGGVLSGQTKKGANNAATNASAALKQKATIKSGPVQDNDIQKKRTKERTITEIIEKVSTWRKLYNGVMIPNR